MQNAISPTKSILKKNTSLTSEISPKKTLRFSLEEKPLESESKRKKKALKLIQYVESFVDQLVSSLFPKNTLYRIFAKRLIKDTFFSAYAEKSQIYLIRSIKRKEHKNLLEKRKKRLNIWLENFNLKELFEKLSKIAIEAYPSQNIERKLLEHYLLNNLLSTLNIEENKSVDAILVRFKEDSKNTFEGRLKSTQDMAQYYFQKNSFAHLLFFHYLVAHHNINDSFGSLKKCQQSFLFQLALIVNTLPPITPIWQTWYLLWHNGEELLAHPNLREKTIEKYKKLYIISNLDNGKEGAKLAEQLSTELQPYLSSSFFREDSRTHQLHLKTRESLEKALNNYSYNPCACFFSGYQSIRETLHLFTRKENKCTSNSK